jgi:hypothetical protein
MQQPEYGLQRLPEQQHLADLDRVGSRLPRQHPDPATGLDRHQHLSRGRAAGGSTDIGDGCVKRCPFSVDNSGEDLANIVCTTEGDCSDVRAWHSIEIVDPAGNTVAVPTLGAATIAGATGTIGSPGDPGDPAKYGDACRTEDPAPDDCND